MHVENFAPLSTAWPSLKRLSQNSRLLFTLCEEETVMALNDANYSSSEFLCLLSADASLLDLKTCRFANIFRISQLPPVWMKSSPAPSKVWRQSVGFNPLTYYIKVWLHVATNYMFILGQFYLAHLDWRCHIGIYDWKNVATHLHNVV